MKDLFKEPCSKFIPWHNRIYNSKNCIEKSRNLHKNAWEG